MRPDLLDENPSSPHSNQRHISDRQSGIFGFSLYEATWNIGPLVYIGASTSHPKLVTFFQVQSAKNKDHDPTKL